MALLSLIDTYDLDNSFLPPFHFFYNMIIKNQIKRAIDFNLGPLMKRYDLYQNKGQKSRYNK